MFQTSVICPVRLARGLAAARRGCIDHGVQRAYRGFRAQRTPAAAPAAPAGAELGAVGLAGRRGSEAVME